MEFEWDPKKARANATKHGVRFSDATFVLDDDSAVTVLDVYPFEERYVTIGRDSMGRVLVVIYAWRGDASRIISARKAIRYEQTRYLKSRP